MHFTTYYGCADLDGETVTLDPGANLQDRAAAATLSYDVHATTQYGGTCPHTVVTEHTYESRRSDGSLIEEGGILRYPAVVLAECDDPYHSGRICPYCLIDALRKRASEGDERAADILAER